MKSILTIAKVIYENLPLILALLAVGGGIAVRVRKFLRMSKEEQTKALQEQADKILELLKDQLLSFVSKAEKEWGSGTGVIKKAWVWEQLTTQFKQLTEFIAKGNIDRKVVDNLIEDAVTELNAIREKNSAADAAVGKTG